MDNETPRKTIARQNTGERGNTTRRRTKKFAIYEGLTEKQYLFANEYLTNGGNATRAILKHFNVQKYETAKNMGSEYLSMPAVNDYIESRMHVIATPNFIEQELLKDVKNGNYQQRTAAIALLAKIKGMVTEKRLNIESAAKEYEGITYKGFEESKDKVNTA